MMCSFGKYLGKGVCLCAGCLSRGLGKGVLDQEYTFENLHFKNVEESRWLSHMGIGIVV